MNDHQTYISEKVKNAEGININPATEEKQNELITLTEMTVLLKSILWAIQYSRNADMTNNSDRVTVINTVPVSLASLATLTNMVNMNSVDAALVPRMSEYSAWNLNVRSTIS